MCVHRQRFSINEFNKILITWRRKQQWEGSNKQYISDNCLHCLKTRFRASADQQLPTGQNPLCIFSNSIMKHCIPPDHTHLVHFLKHIFIFQKHTNISVEHDDWASSQGNISFQHHSFIFLFFSKRHISFCVEWWSDLGLQLWLSYSV